MNVRLEKQKISCRIIIYVFAVKAVILKNLFCATLVFSQDQMTWKKPGKPINKMCFLGLHTSADSYDALIFSSLLLNFLHLCKILQRLQKCFHTTPDFLLNSFIAASTPSERIVSTALQALSCASSTSFRSSPGILPST